MRKTCVFYWMSPLIPVKEGLKLIRQAGFDSVMFWWDNEDIKKDDRSVFNDLARREGLFIENVHAAYGGENSLWLDNAEGDAFEEILADSINDCGDLGVPAIVVHPINGPDSPAYNKTGLDRFKRLTEIAERKNVNIALENLETPEYLELLFNDIQSDKLGFCFDSGHNNCIKYDMDVLSKFGGKLMALHLHDNDGTDDQHMLPFEGNIDWNKIMKQIYNKGYSGAVALEVDLCGSGADRGLLIKDLNRAYQSAVKLRDLME